MIRYLKYIFLIFGALALAIIGFFVFQNKKDLGLFFEYRERLSYDHVSQNCPRASDRYYYPCFQRVFKEYLEKSGLTGVSVGLKLAFNFMDEDKENSGGFVEPAAKDASYGLNYLEINNMAIDQSYRRFYGFENMYGGYLSSLREFLDGAKKFSDNLIAGLEGEEGLAAVNDPAAKERLQKRFERLRENYKKVYGEGRGFVDKEIESFLKKAEGEA